MRLTGLLSFVSSCLAVDWRQKRTCEALFAHQAAAQTHLKYFMIQQEAETTFLQQVANMCAPRPSGTEYYEKLHASVSSMRDKINRHVHAAFFIKQVCEDVVAYAGLSSFLELQHVDEFCDFPILKHEPYNIEEGFYVVNLTNHLIRAGPSFCAQSTKQIRTLVAHWRHGLETAMRAHRLDNSFAVFTEHYASKCAASSSQSAVQSIDAMRQQLEDYLFEPSFDPLCETSTAELISIISSDTEMTLSMAKRALSGPLRRCEQQQGVHLLDPLEWDAFDSRTDRLAAKFFNSWFAIEPQPSIWPSIFFERGIMIATLMFPTVYHKIVPMCGMPSVGRASVGEHWMECDLVSNSAPNFNSGWFRGFADPDAACVYDLVTATDASCNSRNCPSAAEAINELQNMLSLVTPLRTQLVAALFGNFKEAPIVNKSGGLLSCDDQERLVGLLNATRTTLYTTIPRLRAAADALSVAYVAPPRKKQWMPWMLSNASLDTVADTTTISSLSPASIAHRLTIDSTTAALVCFIAFVFVFINGTLSSSNRTAGPLM